MIKAVVFDWFGVITPLGMTNTVSVLSKSLNIDEKAVSAAFTTASKALKIGHVDEKSFWLNFEKLLGVPVNPEQRSIWAVAEECKPAESMLGLVEEIKSLGLKVIVLSNTFPFTYQLIKDYGWYDTFDDVLASSEIGICKPDITAYKLCIDRSKIEPTEILFIDDQEKNLVPAASLGMKTSHFQLATNAPDSIMQLLK